MTRRITVAALTLSVLLTLDHAASAQVVAYHHRSTVLGDHLAGASELVRAQGSFLRDEAEAAGMWIRNAASYDALQYQRREIFFQEKQLYLDYLKAKSEANRERRATEAANDRKAAAALWAQSRAGGVIWPAALTRPEYMGSMSLIDSILRNWSPDDVASSEMYRRALATEAGVLRTRVANNANISFASRVEGVRTLRQLQILASTSGVDVAEPHLAMR